MSAPSQQTILVTGANGYIAGHIIRTFLEQGYNVRGTARSQSSIASVQKAHPQYASQLSFALVPDMTKPEAYETALDGVTGVIHCAAPFVLSTDDVVNVILRPAIDSTTAILEAVKRWGPNVQRVVLTSSFAAALDLAQGYRAGHTYTENDWNPMTFEEAAKADAPAAYCAAKGLSEKAAWAWVEAEKPHFTLTALCPPWVFGPNVSEIASVSRLNESTEAIWKLINATAVPPTDFAGFVDVRDIAKAHLLAYESEEAAGHRFLVGSHFDYQSAVDAIRADLPELKSRVPEGKPGAGKDEAVYQLNGSKAQRLLGLQYTPLNVTMKDTVVQLLEAEKRAVATVA